MVARFRWRELPCRRVIYGDKTVCLQGTHTPFRGPVGALDTVDALPSVWSDPVLELLPRRRARKRFSRRRSRAVRAPALSTVTLHKHARFHDFSLVVACAVHNRPQRTPTI